MTSQHASFPAQMRPMTFVVRKAVRPAPAPAYPDPLQSYVLPTPPVAVYPPPCPKGAHIVFREFHALVSYRIEHMQVQAQLEMMQALARPTLDAMDAAIGNYNRCSSNSHELCRALACSPLAPVPARR